MEGNGESALGVGLPDTGNVSARVGKLGGSDVVSEFCRSIIGGSCDWLGCIEPMWTNGCCERLSCEDMLDVMECALGSEGA